MRLVLNLLGPFQASIDESTIAESRAKKIEALLVYLAVEASHAHRRENLVGLLFPELPDDQARTNLRQTLKRLRDAISDDQADPPFLLVSRESFQFNSASDHIIDLGAFNELLRGCAIHLDQRDGRCGECMARAQAALALYRGPLLAGFFLEESLAFEDWLAGLRENTQQLALTALAQLADYHERRGEYGLAVHFARRQIELEPWREQAHRQLMRDLAYSGQRAAALHQYDQLSAILDQELGVDPLPETKALRRQIASGPETRPSNLPARDISFVGRGPEIAQIHQNLVDPDRRLLNLIGPGGTGKSALAIETGWRVVNEYLGPFMHGVFFVPLASISSAESKQESLNPLLTAVAEAVNFSFSGAQEPGRQLFNYLADRSLLLILDNSEHLLTASRAFIEALLQQTTGPVILVTSRTRLNLSAEWILEIHGLPYSAAETGPLESAGQRITQPVVLEGQDALALFVRRAQRLAPGFDLFAGADDQPGDLCRPVDVARICHLVQGLPLGIELAASWVRFLSCREIANEIDQSLDFLQSTSASLPERQQSLRAVFDSSWAMLPAQEQAVLARLSVFAGAFDRRAAAAVSGASTQQLAALVDHSLITRRSEPSGLVPRFELLAVVRQYAAEKLTGAGKKDEREAHSQHAAYYLTFLRDQYAAISGGQQREALAIISQEMANIRTAWHYAVEQRRVDLIEPALDSLALFYYMRSWFAEGSSSFGLAAEQLGKPEAGPGEQSLWAKLRAQQGWFNFLRSQQQLGQAQMQESLEILRASGRPNDLALITGYLAVICYTLGDYQTAENLAQESLALSEATGSRYNLGVANSVMSQLHYRMGHYAVAHEFGEKSLAQARATGNPWSIGFALINLGRVANVSGAYAQAKKYFQEAMSTREAVGDARGQALCLLYLGDVAAKEDAVQGQSAWQASLGLFQEAGNLEGMASALIRLGLAANEQGKPDLACEQLLEALRLARQAQAAPRMLDALTSLALIERHDAPEQAAEIATLAVQHPATTKETRARAANLLNGLIPDADQAGSSLLSDQEAEALLQRLTETYLKAS